MSDITELVDLPDPALQPLVHPLDVPEARRPFRTSWMLRTSTIPVVGLCVAALVWFVSGNYVAPVIVGVAIISFSALASRCFADQAWAFIPHKRQDPTRRVPVAWELISSLTFGLVLAATLLLVVWRFARSDVTAEVREFTLGMSIAAAVMVLSENIIDLLRHRGEQRRRVLSRLPGTAAVAASVVVFYDAQPMAAGAVTRTTTLWGIVTMLAIGCCIGIWKYREYRRRNSA
jgi:hypothetical protein